MKIDENQGPRARSMSAFRFTDFFWASKTIDAPTVRMRALCMAKYCVSSPENGPKRPKTAENRLKRAEIEAPAPKFWLSTLFRGESRVGGDTSSPPSPQKKNRWPCR